MKLRMLVFVASFCVAVTASAQKITFDSPSNWDNRKNLTVHDGIMTMTGKRAWYFSTKTIDIDPAKTYTIKISYRKTRDGFNDLLFGLQPIDKNGRSYIASFATPIKGTDTELAADINIGDQVIKIKDASTFPPMNEIKPHDIVVYNTDPSYSDLPNYNELSPVVSYEKAGNLWNIRLKTPVNRSLPAGTKIRLHRGGGWYYFSTKSMMDEWMENTYVLSGVADCYMAHGKFPIASKKFRLLIASNWADNNGSMEVKDVSVEIE